MKSVHQQWKRNTQILKKSCAQVATSVLPKRVIPKSCGLKPKRIRPAPIPVRYSKAQLEIVDKKAKQAGLYRSEYIRAQSLGEDYRLSQYRDLAHVLLMLNRELTAQGNNLNQITRQLNGNAIALPESESMLDVLGRSMLRTHKAVRNALAKGDPEP